MPPPLTNRVKQRKAKVFILKLDDQSAIELIICAAINHRILPFYLMMLNISQLYADAVSSLHCQLFMENDEKFNTIVERFVSIFPSTFDKTFF